METESNWLVKDGPDFVRWLADELAKADLDPVQYGTLVKELYVIAQNKLRWFKDQ